MNILGLNLGHDSSCALIMNGKLVFASEQERYSKNKHTREFPKEAIIDCVKSQNLKINDIDLIVVGFLPERYVKEFFLKQSLNDLNKINFIYDGIERIKTSLNLENLIRKKLNFKKKINFVSHHLCHLASTFYPSEFKKSLVVSFDGLGEIESSMFAIGNNLKLNLLNEKNKFPDSLGLIYAATTYFLGWKPFYDEGIVMGLAPYGDRNNYIPKSRVTYRKVFEDLIKYKNNGTFEINLEWVEYHNQRDKWFSDKFFSLFGKKRKPGSNITQHYKDIAAALQARLEEVILKILKYLKNKTKMENLSLAGGVALNCSLNGKIHDSKIFKKIFVQPASSDSGIAIGAAILGFLNWDKKGKLEFGDFYLGSSFSDNKIKKFIVKNKRKKFSFVKSKNIYLETAKYIDQGKIVSWFQGGSEFGPRALGNRSILAKPFPIQIKDHINKNVKFREYFRPFAPAVLEEHASNYFHLNQPSPHMLIACKVKENKVNLIPAVTHVDKSARVQTVSKKSNYKFYKLINEVYRLNQIPVILNTSFNIKGQPIVNDPQDAIDCFLKYKIDKLVIGNYILSKN